MHKRTEFRKVFFSHFSFLFSLLLFAACSFNYGNEEGVDKDQPDIVMENVDYVRVRTAELQARVEAERVERYEERRIMELRNFSFEQFDSGGEEVSAFGRAGSATIEIDTMDLRLDNGVRIDVDSEELAIETQWLEWKDEDRILTGGEAESVNIFQENGTAFTGTGFKANARLRTWEFSGEVSGSYYYEDEEELEEISIDNIDDFIDDFKEDIIPVFAEPDGVPDV